MDKLFRPNRWFVMFCGLLIVVFVTLQIVSNMRVVDESRLFGAEIFTWTWPDRKLTSTAEITDAQVLERNDTSAKVKVKGKQLLRDESASPINESSEDCEAVLTLYKTAVPSEKGSTKQAWVLGQVEWR